MAFFWHFLTLLYRYRYNDSDMKFKLTVFILLNTLFKNLLWKWIKSALPTSVHWLHLYLFLLTEFLFENMEWSLIILWQIDQSFSQKRIGKSHWPACFYISTDYVRTGIDYNHTNIFLLEICSNMLEMRQFLSIFDRMVSQFGVDEMAWEIK